MDGPSRQLPLFCMRMPINRSWARVIGVSHCAARMGSSKTLRTFRKSHSDIIDFKRLGNNSTGHTLHNLAKLSQVR